MYCQCCGITYKCKLSSPEKILRYVTAIGDGGGFSILTLKADFRIDTYDSPFTQNLEARTTVFWPVTPDSSKEKASRFSAFILKIKKHFTKDQGIVNHLFKSYVDGMWERQKGVRVFLRPQDMFSQHAEQYTVVIPYDLIIFPEEFYTNAN